MISVMSKRVKFLLLTIFAFFYLLNCLMPLAFGDDYVYSFIWEGHSLYEPLSEKAVRVTSWKDLFDSQKLHYFTWSGRIVNHTLEQFFLWMGKSVFNICNAFVSLLLVAEIYWCSHKGIISFQMKESTLCGIFFALWAFSPGFGDVFLWIVGACNYLWTITIVIGFLLPYVRNYYSLSENEGKSCFFCIVLFLGGIVAGCTNENTVCWLIPLLLFFIYRSRKGKNENWMYFGLAGLVIGYALLVFSPGNMVRLLAEQKGYSWFSWSKTAVNVALLILIMLYFNILIWFFNLRSFNKLATKCKENKDLSNEVLLAKILCTISFCMTSVMLFSPNFPTRSAFPGTVFLLIAAFILLRVQDEYSVIVIKNNTRTVLRVIGAIFFAVTTAATFYGYYHDYGQIQKIITFVQTSEHAKSNIVAVDALHPVPDIIRKASYFHLTNFTMPDNEKDWHNAAFARYYGIKGIRMIKKNSESEVNAKED